jgi:pilus assembly protein CpaE
MFNRHPAPAAFKTRLQILTADAEFEQLARATLGADLTIVRGALAAAEAEIEAAEAGIVIADLDANIDEDLQALGRLMKRISGRMPMVVVTRALNDSAARQLIQMRVTDVLVKPVAALELARVCARVARAPQHDRHKEAEIYAFLPASGGVGVTTLAIQAAFTLLHGTPRGDMSTCLVDLDFLHGSCADYLDIEPRLDLNEIAPNPERLDRRLLEALLSHHSSGLAVLAAPFRPAETRNIDPRLVTRLLDLVSSRFDYVVIDMPRLWSEWTDIVLLGSNKLFVVSDMSVPGLRHARQLASMISERIGGLPKPQVVVNRFEQRWFSSGLRGADVKKALGDVFGGTIPYDHRLVREAIDRGVPLEEVKRGNHIAIELKKLLFAQSAQKPKASNQVRISHERRLYWATEFPAI